MDNTKSGGELVFMEKGGTFLIGPASERWDAAMLVRQNSVNDFMAFAPDPEYMEGMAHRTAAWKIHDCFRWSKRLLRP